MKNLLSLLLAVLTCALLPAQSTNWFVPGSQWRYDYESLSGPGQEGLKFVGTETKGGQSCAKLRWYGHHDGWPAGPFNYGYAWLYAQNDSVFWWNQDHFQLLYDFTRQPGDTIALSNSLYDFAVVDATGMAPAGPIPNVRYQDLRLVNLSDFGDTLIQTTRVYERIGGHHLIWWDIESPLTEIQYYPPCFRDNEYPQSYCGIAFNPYYVAFPTGPATWSEESSIWCGFTGYQYKVDGDTLLPNLGVAQKVYFRRTYTGTYPCPEEWVEILHEPFNLIGVISQSIPDQKVFFTRMTTDITPFPICLDPFGDDPFPLGETVLLYDFDLDVGDEVAWRSEPNRVLAIDSLQLNDGTWRRVYRFDTDSFYYWIEGIGSSIGLLNSRANLQITDVSCNLNCFRENTALLYNTTNAEFCDSITVDIREPVRSLAVRVYPNPSAGDVRMELPAGGLPAMVRIFDSGGRLLETREIDTSPAALNLTPYVDAGLLWIQIFSADGRRGETVLRLER